MVELVLNVISLVLDDLNGFVINVDTVFSLDNMLVKSLEEFMDLLLEFLALL